MLRLSVSGAVGIAFCCCRDIILYYLDQPSASKMVVTRLVAWASNTSSDYFATIACGNYFAALAAWDMSEPVV